MERKTKEDLINSLKELKEEVHNGNTPNKVEFENYIDSQISYSENLKDEDSPYYSAFYYIVETVKDSYIRDGKGI
jgi:hypothetical protein